MKTKQFKAIRLSNEILTSVLVLGVVILIYTLVSQFLNFRWDLTQSGQFSLNAATLKILQKLDSVKEPVQVTAFYRKSKTDEEVFRRRRVLDLLEEYHFHSEGKIQNPKVIDPEEDPGTTQLYGVKESGTIVFETPGKRQHAASYQIWGFKMIDGKPGPTVFKGESIFTSAINKLVENKTRIVRFLEGHREIDLDSGAVDGMKNFAKALEQQNFSVQKLNLAQAHSIPDATDALVIAGPRQSLLPSEAKIILDYTQRGGKLLFLADFGSDLGLKPVMDFLGVDLGDNLVIDSQRSFYGQLTSIVPLFGEHPIVKEMRQAQVNLLLHAVRSVERGFGNTQGITTTDLLLSSNTSWAEADYRSAVGKQAQVKFDDNGKDIKGPITLALAITHPIEKVEARAVVVGDADFAINDNLKFGGNLDFLINSIHWLVGEESDIAISPKDPEFNPVAMGNRQIWVIFGIVAGLMPGVILFLGALQWWNRRSL